HQGYGLLDVPGATITPAPLLIENGWTDDLFPPAEALRIYNDLRRRDPAADVALQFGDLGHSRGQNKKNTNVPFNDQGSRFFDARLKGATDPGPPAKGSVTTFTQTCPSSAPAGGPFTAASWPAIHPGAFRFGDQDPKSTQSVTSAGGNPQTGKTLDPIAGGGACATVADETAPGTAVYRAKSSGFTLMGLPTVSAKVVATGGSPQLDSRLWDVAPDGTQTLITRGAYRLSSQDVAAQKVTFQLHGNGWRFEAGHTAKLELLGKDEPYLQPNKEPFQIAVSNLVVELPTLEPPTSTEPFSTPPPNTEPAPGSGGGSTGGVIVAPAIGQGKPLPRPLRRLHLAAGPARVRQNARVRVRFVVTTRFNGRIFRVGRVTVRMAGRKRSTNRHGRTSMVFRFRAPGRRAVRADARTYRGDRRHITVVRARRRHG
ncbi:MAG: CocE/NonD family hydrolase C-terminal non-catalytic domain-containing protein, partial [Solirubrobacteraceae bacterium]